jgi:hypothetical protein
MPIDVAGVLHAGIFTTPLKEALAPEQLDVALVEAGESDSACPPQDARKGNAMHFNLIPGAGPPDCGLRYLALQCIMLLCISGLEFVSVGRGVKSWRSTRT